jgi:uncharacterized protein YcfJ
MKKLLIVTALLTGSAMAQTPPPDVAMVINVQPRFVTVQQKQCEVREVVRDNSRGDATIGALAGGAIGSTIGGNSRDRLVGGVVGALIGGAVGSEVGKDSARAEMREVCRIIPIQVQQGRVITFDYHGQQFTQILQY